MFNTTYSYSVKKEGYIFNRSTFVVIPLSIGIFVPPRDERLPLILGTNQPNWVGVSAASFAPYQFSTPEMIVAGFGANLIDKTEIASLPLPTTLAGRKVLFTDYVGVEKSAKLLFVSPGQINYIVPDGLSEGPAVIRLVDESGGLIKIGFTDVKNAAPGIFTANADGKGVPAAVIVRVKPGNVQSYEPVSQFDAAQNRFVPLPLDLGPESEIVVLALFGTGWRQVSPSSVNVTFKGPNDTGTDFALPGSMEYVGKQPTIEGLDQINVRLPRELIGKGDATVTVSFGDFYSNRTVNNVQLKFK